MTEMVKAHLGPLGGIVVEPAAANLHLYINAPAEEQGDGPDQYVLELDEVDLERLPAPTRLDLSAYRRQAHVAGTLREMHSVRRDLPEFVRALAAALDQGLDCAVVDVAFVNAGDVALGDLLMQMDALGQLAAYGGWNTAGNTLGCVLAHAVIRWTQRRDASAAALAAHVRFLFLRLLEDVLYMGRLRPQIMIEDLPQLGLSPTMSSVGDHYPTVQAKVEERLRQAAAELAQRHFEGRSLSAGPQQGAKAITIQSADVAAIALPWQRLFDLTCDVVLGYDEQ